MKKISLCAFLLLLSLAPLAGKDYFTDGGFETGQMDWHYVRKALQSFDGKKRSVSFSAENPHSGKFSLHVSVLAPGKKANVGYLIDPTDLPTTPNRKLHLAGYVRAEKGTPALAYYMEYYDGKGEKKTKTASSETASADGKWQKLSLSFELPEHTRGLAVILKNCEENQLADVYWDDLSLTLEGEEDTDNAPKSIAALHSAFQLPKIVDSDVYSRPEISNGNFSENGKYLFYSGVSLDARNPHLKEWEKKDAVSHFAYQEPPSLAVFEQLGINSCHWIVPDAVINALTTGGKLSADYRDELEKSHAWGLELKGLPVVATGFSRSICDDGSSPEQNQKKDGSAEPVQVGNADSSTTLLTRCEMLVREYFRLGLNVYLYELADDPVFRVQGAANAKRFADAMQKKYSTIARANEVWGTQFRDFGETAKIQSMKEYPKLWPDWCAFSAECYRTFLKSMMERIRKIDRRNNIHFCEQNTDIFSRNSAAFDFAEHTKDLDVLAISGGLQYGDGKMSDAGERFGGESLKYLFLCDFFQAVGSGRKPVCNTQGCCIRLHNGKRVPSRREDLLSSLWVDFFHGLSVSYIGNFDKCREEQTEKKPCQFCSLLNPANYPADSLDVFQQFQQEIGFCLQQTAPAPRAKKAAVALLYSKSTLRMSALSPASPFQEPMLNWYGAALLSQYPVKIVFEDNLEQALNPEVKVLLAPAAGYLPEKAVQEIRKFIARGGKVIADNDAFRFDERGNARKEQPKVTRLDAKKGGENQALYAELEAAPRDVQIFLPDGTPCRHVEAAVIERNGICLVLLFAPMQEKSSEVLVKFPNLPDGVMVLSDAVRHESYDNPAQEITWNAAELRKGVKLLLPGQERRVLLLSKGLPPGYRLVQYNEEQKRAEGIQQKESEKPALPSTLPQQDSEPEKAKAAAPANL